MTIMCLENTSQDCKKFFHLSISRNAPIPFSTMASTPLKKRSLVTVNTRNDKAAASARNKRNHVVDVTPKGILKKPKYTRHSRHSIDNANQRVVKRNIRFSTTNDDKSKKQLDFMNRLYQASERTRQSRQALKLIMVSQPTHCKSCLAPADARTSHRMTLTQVLMDAAFQNYCIVDNEQVQQSLKCISKKQALSRDSGNHLDLLQIASTMLT